MAVATTIAASKQYISSRGLHSSRIGFFQKVNDFWGVFRDSNSQLFGDYSIYLLGINDYLDDYLGEKSDY